MSHREQFNIGIPSSFTTDTVLERTPGAGVRIGSIVRIGTPASISGAVAGDVVLANERELRGTNAAGTGTQTLIELGSDNHVYLGSSGGAIAVGAPGSMAGAGAGDLVLANAKFLRAANVAGTTTRRIARLDAGDQLDIGESANPALLSASRLMLGGTTNDRTALKGGSLTGLQVRMADDSGYMWVEASELRSMATTGAAFNANGVQLLTQRRTGWGAPTGTATRTTFATGTVTLPLLAERVKALIDDLTTHGVIGA